MTKEGRRASPAIRASLTALLLTVLLMAPAVTLPGAAPAGPDLDGPEIRIPLLALSGTTLPQTVWAGVRAQALPQAALEQAEASVVWIRILVQRRGGGRPGEGSGSGIVLEPSGLVLTAEHVVRGAVRVMVTTRDRSGVHEARVLGADALLDAALLEVDGLTAPPLPVGQSGLLQPGDPVIALGRAPRRSEPSSGTVVDVSEQYRPGVMMIRHSAPVFPGDSGGALLNTRGELIGLVVASARTGGGLAVAIDDVRRALDQLRTGTIRRPWLGISGTTITREIARDLNLPVQEGILVIEVIGDGPAARAGLRGGQREGDVIVAIDGRSVTSFETLLGYVLRKQPGEEVTLTVLRDGQTVTVRVTLQARPADM
ncbi:MAG: trypsin-like peptidase domain-containing protein [Armatimonadetes bacterium]|nr:trypsin-like peptidase domain-containing protein [Armatimonadota bacterium]